MNIFNELIKCCSQLDDKTKVEFTTIDNDTYSTNKVIDNDDNTISIYDNKYGKVTIDINTIASIQFIM